MKKENYIKKNKICIKIKMLFLIFLMLILYLIFLNTPNKPKSQPIISKNETIIVNSIKNISINVGQNITKNISYKIIEIDNNIDTSCYKNNIDFSSYSTDIKAISIYLPNFYSINATNNVNNKDLNSLNFLEKGNPLFKGHHQPRSRKIDNYLYNYNQENSKTIKKQIKLAKSHGIYGFAIYYYWSNGKTIFNRPLNLIYESKIKFHYMLIWKNENILNENNEVLLEQKYEENYEEKFILDIEKYLKDERYIKIDGKPIIGIFNLNNIPKIDNLISIWRTKSKELRIGDIFIILCLNQANNDRIYNSKLFDGAYKSPPYDIPENTIIKNTRNNFTYYYGLFYSNIFENKKLENFPIFKGSVIEWDKTLIDKKGTIYGEYNTELFFLMNKMLIKWTKDNYNENHRFIFINAWNNYYEGTYLEPDEKFGYGSINAFSKALFNISYRNNNYNISSLKEECLVAVQAHIFYDDLTGEIINKINNIPVKFDLYITTTDNKKMKIILNYIKTHLKANNYTITVVNNSKEDVFPLLIQMEEIILKYKYFCHIHSKKTGNSKLGLNWRRYLLNNLLGDSEVISDILSDFENYEKLGFIFPQNFQMNIGITMDWFTNFNKYQNSLLDILFPGQLYKVTEKYFDFPAGTMFWARTKSIYQLFQSDKIKEMLKNSFYPYVIERTLLFVVKINGYYYKKIFKYLE